MHSAPAAAGPEKPLSALRTLFGYVRPYRGTLIAGGVVSFLGGILGLAAPLATKEVLDTLSAGGDLTGPVLLMAVLFVLAAALHAGGTYLLERTGENVVRGVRVGLVGRIMRLRVRELDQNRPGDLMARVTSDTTLLRQVSAESLANTVNGVLLLIGALVVMVFMDLVLLLVTAGVVLMMMVCEALVLPRIGRATGQAQAALGEIGSDLERTLGAFRTVKASGAEARETDLIAGHVDLARRAGYTVAAWHAVATMTAGLAIQLAFLAVLGVGGARVLSGDLPISSLVAFLLYLYYLNRPIDWLTVGATQLQVGLAAVHRVRDVEQLKVEEPAPVTVTAPQGEPGAATVEFAGVSFRYREDTELVHNDLSFVAPAGSMTALVGSSGAGKSTVFALLERFYEADRGSVTIDGRDVRDWPLHELRRTIGYVEQDAPVLHGTLRDNLRFAAPEATDEQIRQVLELTRLDSLLRRLPEGLDTAVGHRGTTLSGGERQRIAIARALLRYPRLLLLDEATSQLDSVNEAALREVVADIAGTTTVLVIAHRLSTVASASQILVLDAGKVRASGTHRELISDDDLYRQLAATQFAAASVLEPTGPEA
ncbi:ABC transporter ATP-binding protein/permease [Crossiella sp. SN42]|uniref:ABC transporter ATP-binding protein n=1 Tax=Crossiella sp. SN42 TaxID=2944808 RepID=UPI00207C994D|nr:ABC transporter ATP-binding protein [Crossiella sp. SN42]MCO1577286.1 ABC transporter ATP-binding protein/permease [Crossiella sp. SN42]